jgi:hypothetical protein
MQIRFRVCYPKHTDPIIAQENLLDKWVKSCERQQIKFIEKASLSFNTYEMLEYPDQELLKKEYAIYFTAFNSDLSKENIDCCFERFSEDYYLMELVITPEDYD